jgi:hypothetical protein
VGTVSLIKKCIDQFRLLSSLSSNHDKSSMFLCGVKHVFKTPLLEVHKERICQSGTWVFLLSLQSSHLLIA